MVGSRLWPLLPPLMGIETAAAVSFPSGYLSVLIALSPYITHEAQKSITKTGNPVRAWQLQGSFHIEREVNHAKL